MLQIREEILKYLLHEHEKLGGDLPMFWFWYLSLSPHMVGIYCFGMCDHEAPIMGRMYWIFVAVFVAFIQFYSVEIVFQFQPAPQSEPSL